MSGMLKIRPADGSCGRALATGAVRAHALKHLRVAVHGHPYRTTRAHSINARQKQNRANTPQDPPTADHVRAPRLSTVPEAPAGMEPVAMSTTAAATSSPSARGGAWTWLRARWQNFFAFAKTAPQTQRTTLRHFREFTVPAHLHGNDAANARVFDRRASRRDTESRA